MSKKKSKKYMRLPNSYGGVVYLGKNRRRPYGARVTTGFIEKGVNAKGVMQYRQTYKYIGYFEKRIDALNCLLEYNKSPYDLNASTITLKGVYDNWSSKAFSKLSVNSVRVYKTAFKKLEPLHSLPFAELRTVHLQNIIDAATPSAAKPIKLVLGLLYKYALKNDIAQKDYSKFIELPKIEKKQPPKPFTKEEIELLWSLKGSYYVDMLLILLYSGMRITELLILENKNIHINKRYMVGGIKTAAGKNRVIPIHKDIEPLIINYMSNNTTLFYSRAGTPLIYENVRRKIVEFFSEFNMLHTSHDCRHSFISQASRLGLDPLTVKRIVGHANKDVTENYTHKIINDLISTIDNFNY